nr:hypothetical protein [Tanacetum cinerariifolium]
MQTQTSNTLHNAIMEAGGKYRPPMLAPGNYLQWKSRIKRYIDTKPNHELIYYYIKNPPYKFTWADKVVPVSEGSPETTTERYMETYKNVSQDIRNQMNAKSEAVQIILTGIDNDIYSIVDVCPNACEIWKAIERDGESLESYNSRFYKMKNELVRNQCDITNHQVNVQFLLQLQPKWQRSQQAATKNRGKAIVNSPTPIYDQETFMFAEDDEMSKDKEIDKLMDLISLSFKKIYKPTNNLQTSSNTSRANQDNSPRISRGVGYDNQRLGNVAGARETVGTMMVRKSGIQCYNCKKFRHVARECQKPQRAKNAAYHREKMLLCKQEEAGTQLNAEQADWRDDTDDESEDQELEAHYMYMAQIQEVSPDAADSGPIFDFEPLQKVSNDDHYNVFVIESEHPEQSKSVHDTYLIEQDEHNVIIDPLDMSYDREQIDQNDDDDLANECELLASLIEKLKCKIDDSKSRNKFLETLNKVLVKKLKGEIKDFKTQNKSLESSNNRFKEANNKLSQTNVLMYNDLKKFQAELNRRNDVEPEFLKKAQRANRRLYDIGCYNDNLALMLAPESDEDLKAQLQDKGIAIRKPTIFSDSLERKDFSKSKSVTKNNVSNDFSKPVTTQILPSNKKSILKNTNLFAPGMYKLHTEPTQTRTSQLPNDFRKTNKRISFSTGVIPTTSVSRSQLKIHRMEDRVRLNNSQGKKQKIEDHHRNVKFSKNKTSITACNDSLKAKTSNVNFVCATCGKCVLNAKHNMCVLHSSNIVNSMTKMPIAVPFSTREPKRTVNQSVAKPLRRTVASESTNQKPKDTTRKLYEHVTKTCSWWYPKFTPPGYNWKPKSEIRNVNSNLVEIILFIVDSGYSKHMTGNLKLLIDFVEKFQGTVKFRNDQIAPILGYGDLVLGAVTIKRIYYVKGLNHNLFSVDQFCDADLEVAFWKSTCYIRDLKGNNLLIASINGKKYVLIIVDDYFRYTWTHFLRSKDETPEVLIDFLRLVQRGLHAQVRIVRTDKDTKFLNKTLHAYFASEGILHQTSIARTPKQNGVVKRRNRTLVEVARTMLSAAKVPLFFLVEAIATTRFTQNSSLEKGDACIFVGYSTQSRAYRVFNKRTRVIVETIHVNFDELPQMASDHASSDPVSQCQRTALKHDSLSPSLQCQENVPHAAKTVTMSNDLNLLFSLMFAELLNGSSQVVSKSSTVTISDAPNQRQQENTTPLNTQTTTEPTCQVLTQAPTVTSIENINQAEMIAENAHVKNDEFINIFCTPVQDIGETSSRHVDSSNMHTFYQHHPIEHCWTKDHPLEQVIRNPSQSVRTRRQQESDGEMCMFALTVSRTEPKNIKEAMANSAWIESMQEELHQFDRLDVWELVDIPLCKNVINMKWLWKNKHDEENTFIRNKSCLVAKGYAQKEGVDFEESFVLKTKIRSF